MSNSLVDVVNVVQCAAGLLGDKMRNNVHAQERFQFVGFIQDVGEAGSEQVGTPASWTREQIIIRMLPLDEQD